MPQRKYSKTKIESKKRTKRITIPIDLATYTEISSNKRIFRQHIDKMSEEYPELFPDDLGQGYKLHGVMPPSKKMPHVQLPRIQPAPFRQRIQHQPTDYVFLTRTITRPFLQM